MKFRHRLLLTGALLLSTPLLGPHPSQAQDSRGSTGAVVLLGKVTSNIADATSVEYVSTVHTVNTEGRPVTLFIHAKIRKPMSLRVTVSQIGVDASDALLIVGDANTITGYDPSQKRVAHQQVTTSGPNMVLPFGFAAADPAFATVRQIFGPSPFNSLLYGDTRAPLTLVRHGLDVPGALLINAQWATDLIGQERIAKLWVDIDGTTPRRLLIGEIMDGTQHVNYVEDFTSFTLNPTFPDGTFVWTAPVATQTVASAPPTPAASTSAKPAKGKKSSGKATHHHAG